MPTLAGEENPVTDPDLSTNLCHLSNEVRAAEVKLAEARERRDRQIRKAVKIEGRTMYAVAQLTGLTQPSVKKIVAK